jgi:hypothetical protein
MLVEMLTGQFLLEDILSAAQLLVGGGEEDNKCTEFVRKWADEINKWELGTIEEVSGNMEESAEVTERNHSVRKNVQHSLQEWVLDQ